MTKTEKQHVKEAMQHPADIYQSPEDVLNDQSLSYEKKLKVLKNWADEIQQLLESEAENMHPEQGLDREAVLLQRISSAISRAAMKSKSKK